jgi:threonine dehydratase
MDLTDNEMAKLHVRYMVGGRAPSIGDAEIVYRFEFPGAAGRVAQLPEPASSTRWNISLFHYRNHGAAYARVLVGFQVPEGDRGALAEFFAEMTRRHRVYSYWDETDESGLPRVPALNSRARAVDQAVLGH